MLRTLSTLPVLPLLLCTLVAACGKDEFDELLDRGGRMLREQRYVEAIQAYEEASSLEPENPRPLTGTAMALVLLGRGAQAVQVFEHGARLGAEFSAEEYVFWASALQMVARPQDAVRKYEAALQEDPEHLPALNNLAILLIEASPKRAIELLESAVSLKPGDPQFLYNLGRAYEKAGREEEAYNLIRRAVAMTRKESASYPTRVSHLEKLREALPRAAPPADAPNVLFVVIDTLRADHLGAYGYDRDTSPHFDALAREGVLFENAISQAPWTAPSVASMFTGVYPSVHGLDKGYANQRIGEGILPGEAVPIQRALSPAQPTLAEVLRRHGYRTVGFISNNYVHSILGFAQGFDLYVDLELTAEAILENAGVRNQHVFRWLEERPREPFFLFVHYNDPHHPYHPPPPFDQKYVQNYPGDLTPADTYDPDALFKRNLSPEDVAYLVALYDGEIAHNDLQLGRLMDRLRGHGFERDLLTVATSDHGEEFYDHGRITHGHSLYEEQIHVPLLFHAPGRLAPRRVTAQVRLVDLMPTIRDLVGVEWRSEPVQGRSLVALIRGNQRKTSEDAFSEATWRGKQKAIRTPAGLKLIHSADGKDLLFDLREDPAEANSRADEVPETAMTLRQKLLEWVGTNQRVRKELHGENGVLQEVVLDDKLKAQLEALGYVGQR